MQSFQGQYISGVGDVAYLELIEKSFSMLNTSAERPYLKMLYKAATNHFSEGFIWGTGWWMQNSYGLTLGAVPILKPILSRMLQRSYDSFWKRIGDGKRNGRDNGILVDPDRPVDRFVAPDGALGDAVFDDIGRMVYRQGDGDVDLYDWFYEATAAGLNMQADLLLFDRQIERIQAYLPLMWRSVEHIETTRAENGLFLVGPSCNLLAPSYGGSLNKETGKIEKGYLTGLAITYSAALKKLIELLKMVGDTEKEQICRERLQRTLDALPLLLTDEGYFAKSMDPDGTLHGVYGAPRYGYLEGVCNVDAIANGVVDDAVAESIYRKIASVKGIRQAGILCNNYPHLDDTYRSYQSGSFAPDSLDLPSGSWVDGGCWCTVEGRAILSYLHLEKYDDCFTAADVYMHWADEYRQDAPFTQWGHNSNNFWQRENDLHTVCERPVAVVADNFAAPTCLLRGLFEYRATAEGLRLIPHIPTSIREYVQHEPVYFGGCEIRLSYRAGEGALRALVNGNTIECGEKEVFIPNELLRRGETVTIQLGRDGVVCAEAPSAKAAEAEFDPQNLPQDLAEIYFTCKEELQSEQKEERADVLREILLSCRAASRRRELPFAAGILRPMTEEKKEAIVNLYDETVREWYHGLKRQDSLL